MVAIRYKVMGLSVVGFQEFYYAIKNSIMLICRMLGQVELVPM